MGVGGYERDMDIQSQSDGAVRLLTLIPAFYDAMFNMICTNGWTENENIGNAEYMQELLKTGAVYISSIDNEDDSELIIKKNIVSLQKCIEDNHEIVEDKTKKAKIGLNIVICISFSVGLLFYLIQV